MKKKWKSKQSESRITQNENKEVGVKITHRLLYDLARAGIHAKERISSSNFQKRKPSKL